MKFYNQVLTKLRNKIPMKMSRWGDGEFFCMIGMTGRNRDGNEYLPELGSALRKIIESEPKYYIGLQPGVLVDVGRGYVPELRAFVMQYLFNLNLNNVIGDVFHYASEFGYLGKFIEVLKTRNVIIVGAEYFNEIPWAENLAIPERDSFLSGKDIIWRIEQSIDWNKDPVYLVAAAMNSNVIIDALPEDVTAIDIGSVLDPYLGRPRATYQHNMKIEKLW